MSVPPIDTNGQLEKSLTFLRRVRKQLAEFDHDYQKFLVDSLKAGVPYGIEDNGEAPTE